MCVVSEHLGGHMYVSVFGNYQFAGYLLDLNRPVCIYMYIISKFNFL